MSTTTKEPSVLESADLERYAADGYLVLRGVFSTAEMAALRQEADRLIERTELIDVDNLRCRWQSHADSGECLFECFDPVIDLGRQCASIARDERILRVLAALYGDPACLFKDKLIFKPPGAKGYGLHQDYISWPTFPRSFTTVLVPIDAAGVENGATEVFPGCHRQGYLAPQDGMYHELSTTAIDESRGVILELEPGDIAIFGCLMPHRSAPNGSSGPRRQLYLSYNARQDGGERRGAHYREFHDWLRARYAEYGKTAVYFR